MGSRVEWRIDDRPPRLWTRVYVAVMWAMRDKQAFTGERNTLQSALRRQSHGDRRPTRWTRWRREVREASWEAMTVWSVRPRTGQPSARVLYLHGGGYLHPLTRDY